jgi:hypothetical protein
MSTRIPLAFEEFLDPHWAQQGITALITRLVVRVAFVTPDGGSTEERKAVFDTGAPVALLPLGLWQRCAVTIKGESVLRGVIRKRECELPVQIGEVTCHLPAEDGSTVSVPLTAYLAPVEDIALLLGCDRLLGRFQVVIDRPHKAAYLEELSD